MPWQSTQQAKWGHSPSGLKALGGAAKVREWDAATPKGSLAKGGSTMASSGGGIHLNPANRGKLHEAMGIPEGKTISLGQLMKTKAKAKGTGNSTLMKRATFAANAKKWNGGGAEESGAG